jgi:hypothetical protein
MSILNQMAWPVLHGAWGEKKALDAGPGKKRVMNRLFS